jgi:hypothetical protein
MNGGVPDSGTVDSQPQGPRAPELSGLLSAGFARQVAELPDDALRDRMLEQLLQRTLELLGRLALCLPSRELFERVDLGSDVGSFGPIGDRDREPERMRGTKQEVTVSNLLRHQVERVVKPPAVHMSLEIGDDFEVGRGPELGSSSPQEVYGLRPVGFCGQKRDGVSGFIVASPSRPTR